MRHIRYFWIFATYDILSSKVLLLKNNSNLYIFNCLIFFFSFCVMWRSWRLLCLVWIRPAEYLYRQNPPVLAAATSVVHLSHLFTVLSCPEIGNLHIPIPAGWLQLCALTYCTRVLYNALIYCRCFALSSSTYWAQPTAHSVLSPGPFLGILFTDRIEPCIGEPTLLAQVCVFLKALEDFHSLMPVPCTKILLQALPDCLIHRLFPMSWVYLPPHEHKQVTMVMF